jgi:hypothetical protein
VKSAEINRTMKQLLEYKMGQILLDQPPEGEEPIYVDGTEGNFGDDFAADKDKSFWFDEMYYHYSYRIDSEEVDLGSGGGITGEEEETAPEPEPRRDAGAENPLGALGAEGESDEDLGQLRYRVTLTIMHHNNAAHLNRSMSAVAYVKHPQVKETMTGPEGAGGPGAMGGGMTGGMMQQANGAGMTGTSIGAGMTRDGRGGIQTRGASTTTIFGGQPKAGGRTR